ncbi:MAG TPA: toll/interleukin-1 receptor domain-containing protein, partial [Anaerolineales bacterium]
MASLFISYSRKDREAARKLTEAFHNQDLDFWIDWEGIEPTVDWWREIEKGIEGADNFLFLISPDSASSDVCRQEIEHAVKNGKRL